MTLEENAEILKGLKVFYLTTVEPVPRELVSYGVTVSNFATITKRKRFEVGVMAGNVHDWLKRSTTVSNTKKESKDGPLPPKALMKELPRVFFRAVRMHDCRCLGCDPKYHEGLLDEANNKTSQLYEASLTKEVKATMVEKLHKKHYENLNKIANDRARRKMRAVVFKEEIQAYAVRRA